jgi:hypothetical protein
VEKNSVTVILFIIIVALFFFHIDPTFYSLNVECLWSNHVNLRTRFCFKNNARRVLRSPSARGGNAMAKRKRTITDLQNTTQKTIISPHSDIFFNRKQKSDFYFLDINKTKISKFPSNFYHKFLVENCRAGLMIFMLLSCQFILFL